MKRIVLTGGPGSGKTVISTFLAKANPGRFVAVPEAATQVYQAARTRWDWVDAAGKRDLQRRIYHLQLEQEARLGREFPDKILLLDRGTIDGATYWPEGAAAYWEDLKTNLPAELARYDLVILLQTAAAIGIYDGSESNPVRFEDQAAAMANEQILSGLWSKHANFTTIAASAKLEDKIMAVGAILKRLA